MLTYCFTETAYVLLHIGVQVSVMNVLLWQRCIVISVHFNIENSNIMWFFSEVHVRAETL